MPAAGIGLLIMAHVADYVTFVVMVAREGLGTELNPIVATIAADWGLALLTVAKFATVLFVAATFLIVGRTRPRLAGFVLKVPALRERTADVPLLVEFFLDKHARRLGRSRPGIAAEAMDALLVALAEDRKRWETEAGKGSPRRSR